MLHIRSQDKDFPVSLHTISTPPRELYIESAVWQDLLAAPALAVVGSRRLSPYGRAVTESLVKAVAMRGVVIVSGLALGIDSVAHQAALSVGGKTIAVLPSGLAAIYPSTHAQLAQEIVKQGGALVSEYTPKTTAAFKGNFIARNRLIAGLAKATLVTEAAENSGSLHTANFALNQGKEVLAVPGAITGASSAGCNNLIKQGATVVTGPDDIFAALQLKSKAHKSKIVASSPAEFTLLSLLQQGISDGDELYNQSQLPFHEFQQTLSMLEITEKVKNSGANMWTLT